MMCQVLYAVCHSSSQCMPDECLENEDEVHLLVAVFLLISMFMVKAGNKQAL
jgi:hypothetical protein